MSPEVSPRRGAAFGLPFGVKAGSSRYQLLRPYSGFPGDQVFPAIRVVLKVTLEPSWVCSSTSSGVGFAF
jgi:hypothetical protein